MDAGAICFALGQQACFQPLSVWKDCTELHACGVFRRQKFFKGLQSSRKQLEPEQLVSLVTQLVTQQLFGLGLLQALLPDPAQAFSIIQQACSTQQCTLWLLQMQASNARAANRGLQLAARTPSPAVQLLQMLLEHALRNGATATACNDHEQFSKDDVALQQYVLSLVKHLQEAAAIHELLAVCLFQAAEACVPTTGSETVCRWMLQQLQRTLDPAISAELSGLQQHASAVAAQSWQATAFTSCSWSYIVPCILACVPDGAPLLQQLQGRVPSAVYTAQGLDTLCGAMLGLQKCSNTWSAAVFEMLVSLLDAALHEGQLGRLLPPLLLSQRLLSDAEYSRVLSAAASPSCSPDSPNLGPRWSCLLGAVTLLLPSASEAVLHVHLKVLQHHLPAAAGMTRAKISSTIDTLEDVFKQQQATEKKPIAKLNFGDRQVLDDFRQLPVGAGNRRRLTGASAQRWKFYKGHVPAFCEAISCNAPGSVEEARVRWEFQLALQDIGVLPLGQLDKFWQALSSFGISMQEVIDARGAAAQQAEGTTVSPVQALQQLLNKLPAAVAGQHSQAAIGLLNRTEEQLKQILQQESLVPATDTLQDGPPAKRQHTEAGSVAAAGAAAAAAIDPDRSLLHSQLVQLLVEALGAAMEFKGKGIAWRVGFMNLLQNAIALHGALLQQLLDGMTGCLAEQNPKLVAAKGRLLALMGCCKPSQILLLQPTAGANIIQQDCVAPAYTWTSSNTTTAQGAAEAVGVDGRAATTAVGLPAADLSGVELVQQLLSRVSVDSPQQCCSAVSFWAGYMAEVRYIGRWCAGLHGPFQKERPSSTGTNTTGSPSAAAGQSELVAYVPVQIVSLLKTLQQQLTDALQTDNVGQQDAELVQGCYQVSVNTLRNSRPLRWICQQFQV